MRLNALAARKPWISHYDLSITSPTRKTGIVVKQLIRLRNESDAFNGVFDVSYINNVFVLSWKNGNHAASLNVNFSTMDATIHTVDNGEESVLSINTLLA